MMNYTSGLLRRWMRSAREIGHGATWVLAVDKVLRALSGGHARLVVYALIAQPIGSATGAPLRASSATVMREVCPDDEIVQEFQRPPEVVHQRFQSGGVCLASTVKGHFAGMLWYVRTHYAEDEVRCLYRLAGPDQCWDYDLHIEPAYRSSRVFARLWQYFEARLQDEGVTWSLSRVSLHKAESLAAHTRMGAKRIGTACFFIVGPIQVSLFTRAPYLHFSWSARHIPVLRLGDNLPRLAGNPQPDKAAAPPLRQPTRPISGATPAALVLGLDSHGLSVVRGLADAGVTVYALMLDIGRPGALSNRLQKAFTVADFSAPNLLPALEHVRPFLAGHSEIALIATNDRQVTVIAEHLAQLQPLYRIAWADQAATILKLQRKDQLEQVVRQQGLNYPRSVLFEQTEVLEVNFNLRFPVIIKPARPLSSFKTLLLASADELQQALKAYAHDLPILGQEYIAGDDSAIYFGALMLDKGRVLFGMAGRKIASHPPARGQTTAAETVNEPEVLRLTEQFFDGMHLSGPVSLELKKDSDGKFWVIEPTVGRTDFWSELCISAGFNQPHMEFQLACDLPVTVPDRLEPCVWFDSERDPLAYTKLCLAERRVWPRGKRPVFPFMGHSDLNPWLRAVAQHVKWRLKAYARWPIKPGGQVRPH